MSTPKAAKNRVQVFGRKKSATAVALCTEGKGLIRVNGRPLNLVEPQCLRFKVIALDRKTKLIFN